MSSVLDSPDISTLSLLDKTIYLLGTAHVSPKSVELVDQAIRELRPDTVAVELCKPRLDTVLDPDRWKKTDIIKVIKEGKIYVLMAQLFLASYQKKIAEKIGIKPGDEIRKALLVADELKIPTAVIDREIKVTLRRAWGKMTFSSLLKLLFASIFEGSKASEVTEDEIERIKEESELNKLTDEFARYVPDIKAVLLDERDSYMVEKLATTPGQTILAVVGAAHAPGMKKKIGTRYNLAELETIPSGGFWTWFFKWGLPFLLVFFFVMGFFQSGSELTFRMALIWVLLSGGLAALGAIVCLAHPFTIIAAFFSAPITTLHPMLAVGWVCGLIEAAVKKPLVSDFETISDDLNSFRSFLKNRLGRIIAIMLFTNLGAAAGAMIGIGKVAALLKW
ncbi:TraB/GumN family protein [bacterium]|nr:TraB/GumN family protein [bacterium]